MYKSRTFGRAVCQNVAKFTLLATRALVLPQVQAQVQEPTTPVVIGWEPPTARVDGTALDPATELSAYRLYCESADVVAIPAASNEGRYEVPLAEVFPQYGTYDCSLTAVDTEGRESARSNTVAVVWPAARPNEPTQLIILTGVQP